MARRKKGGHEEHENSERWLLTYADMITLLMAFFIMMYSMSVLNLAKFNEAAFSIRSGFGGILKGTGKHLLDKHHLEHDTQGRFNARMREREPLREAEQQLLNYIEAQNLKGKVTITRDPRGLVISIVTDGVMFARGSAELTPLAWDVLARIEKTLHPLPNNLLVEGHTCPLPISSAQFPSNWELSAARACRVVRFLGDRGVPTTHMMAIGYGDTRPRVPNKGEAQRAMNRRVDIVVLNRKAAGGGEGDKAGTPPDATLGADVQGVKPSIPKIWDAVDKSVQPHASGHGGGHE